MTGRVTAARRRHVTIELDAAHRMPGGPSSLTLPAGYAGEHVDYGYARTVDTAQGATVDHSLFAPSASATAERAYSHCPAGDCPTASTPPTTAPGSTPSASAAATRSPSTRSPTPAECCNKSFESAARASTATVNRHSSLVCSSRSPRRPRPWRPGSAGLTHRQPDRPTGVWARSPEAGRSTRRTIADPGSP
jgi:hypothetical protein